MVNFLRNSVIHTTIFSSTCSARLSTGLKFSFIQDVLLFSDSKDIVNIVGTFQISSHSLCLCFVADLAKDTILFEPHPQYKWTTHQHSFVMRLQVGGSGFTCIKLSFFKENRLYFKHRPLGCRTRVPQNRF